jgi:DNA-binding NarL/FixJ family response regulator
MPLRVALADDGFLALEALTALLTGAPEVDLVAACHDGDELRAAVEELRPDVVLTDLRMPPSMTDEGVRFAVEMQSAHPDMGVVVLSMYCEPLHALALMEAGTAGRAYLLKDGVHSARQLVATIESVASGGSVMDPRLVEALLADRRRAVGRPRALAHLSEREHEILAEMAHGASNSAIAGAMGLTTRSVEKHVSSIFTKLQLPATPDVSRRVRAVLRYLTDAYGMPTAR